MSAPPVEELVKQWERSECFSYVYIPEPRTVSYTTELQQGWYQWNLQYLHTVANRYHELAEAW